MKYFNIHQQLFKIAFLFLIGIFFLECSPNKEDITQKNGIDKMSWMLEPFKKHEDLFPLLKSDTATFLCPVSNEQVRWREYYVFNPAAIVKDNKVYLLFRGEDKIGAYGGTSRLGIAVSDDGYHFTASPTPILYPDNDEFLEFEKDGGVEDPRIVESEDGTYIMTYTAFNGKMARLMVATTKDLYNWEKHGPVFRKATSEDYTDLWSKSGAIICKRTNDQMIATKINGKYWMYWGETDIYMATSDDLINWEPLLKKEKVGKHFTSYDGNGQYTIEFDDPIIYFKTAISTRKGRFDSGLVEPGPPAILTKDGIFFIYNASNDANTGDKTLIGGEYTVGQVMFDHRDPSAIIHRCENYFLSAKNENEVIGQMSNTAFVEAMIHFNETWFIYYVMGEAGIGVATCNTVYN